MLLLQVIAALDPVSGDLFEHIFEEHSDRVYKIAYSYVNHKEDAKDIVQDTFLKVYLHIRDFRDLEREKIIAMIVIYTKNTVIDFIRKKSRRLPASSLTDECEDGKEMEIPDEQDTPEDTVITLEERDRLAKLVGLLPDAQREVIVLKYYCGMKEREIAEALNISEGAVKLRVYRAKAKLRERMGGRTDE